jgi:hypothetical protein
MFDIGVSELVVLLLVVVVAAVAVRFLLRR